MTATELAVITCSEAEAIAINAIWTAGQPRQRPHLPMGQPRTAQTRARRRKRILCSPASARPISGCPGTSWIPFIFKSRRISSDSLPMPSTLVSSIWDWDFSSMAVPATTRTLAGRNSRPPTSANAGVYGAQCGHDTATVSHHRGARAVLPEGVFHNGYIKSLKELVHFYNTRDVFKFNVPTGRCPTGTIEKVTCWPAPEVPDNMTMSIGSLGLSDTEENQLVAFLQTLTDGFTTPYPHINTLRHLQDRWLSFNPMTSFIALREVWT